MLTIHVTTLQQVEGIERMKRAMGRGSIPAHCCRGQSSYAAVYMTQTKEALLNGRF